MNRKANRPRLRLDPAVPIPSEPVEQIHLGPEALIRSVVEGRTVSGGGNEPRWRIRLAPPARGQEVRRRIRSAAIPSKP